MLVQMRSKAKNLLNEQRKLEYQDTHLYKEKDKQCTEKTHFYTIFSVY